jgi:hypothetical protein
MPLESAREVRRPQASVVRERLEPAPRSTLRPELREPAPAVVSRRPVAPPLSAGSRDAQMTLPVRERITFPSGLDTDWDTPAFQRRQSG